MRFTLQPRERLAVLEHRAKKWVPVFGNTLCENKKLERADDSHFALSALDRRLLLAGDYPASAFRPPARAAISRAT